MADIQAFGQGHQLLFGFGLLGLLDDRRFVWFFWFYNAGVALTAARMVWNGALTARGQQSSPAISGIAGRGHIAVTVGIVLFFLILGRVVRRDRESVA